MGVSTIVASTVVIYVLLVVGGFLAGLTVYSLTKTIESQDKLLSNMVSDNIDFQSMTYGIVNSTSYIDVNLTNIGSTNIYSYENMDVIVYYTSSTGSQEIYRAPFRGTTAPGTSPAGLADGWYIVAFYDVTGKPISSASGIPGLWKPNTTMEMLIVLPSTPNNTSQVSVTIATVRGGYEYFEFTWG